MRRKSMSSMIAWDIYLPTRIELGPQITSDLAQHVHIDHRTGRVTIDEKALRVALTRAKAFVDPDEALKSIVEFFELGTAQPRLVRKNQAFGVPWGVIKGFLEAEWPVPRFLLRELGLTGIRSEKGIRRRLEERFAWVPAFLNEPPALQRLRGAALRKQDDQGWYPSDGPRPKSPITPLPPPVPLPDVWTCISSTRGVWSADSWGVLLCLDSPCAEAFAYALESFTLAGSFQNFATAVAAQAAQVITYGAMTSFVGFTVQVAITVGVGVLKINILTENQKSNGRGVCIRFYWPYIPFVGGTAWATAR
jgi:hypothetical protein